MRIDAADRAGLERLQRYCARPPFAMDRLKQRGADLVYRCGKVHAEPLPSSKYAGELVLTPLEATRLPRRSALCLVSRTSVVITARRGGAVSVGRQCGSLW